jgi:hypothetical protein
MGRGKKYLLAMTAGDIGPQERKMASSQRERKKNEELQNSKIILSF